MAIAEQEGLRVAQPGIESAEALRGTTTDDMVDPSSYFLSEELVNT